MRRKYRSYGTLLVPAALLLLLTTAFAQDDETTVVPEYSPSTEYITEVLTTTDIPELFSDTTDEGNIVIDGANATLSEAFTDHFDPAIEQEANFDEESARDEKSDAVLSTNYTRSSTIQGTINLLEAGDRNIVLSDDHKDVVLVLGNTGAGKSTFTQWIAKDDHGLEAVEVAPGEYLIHDKNNKIGNTTIKSKTTFPELVLDVKTNTSYYDFPGFSDTRSTSNDIATSYFIKKVIDHADRIKIVFVVSHPSLMKGVDRQDFLKVLRHMTELVKDIDQYRHSIAMIATKVGNQYFKVRGKLQLRDDEIEIETIARFLKEVRNDLSEITKLRNVTQKDHIFYENSVKLVDSLLSIKGVEYPKIGIFRRPDEPGNIEDIFLLRMEKQHVKQIIFEEIKYVTKSNDDFGHTVSDKSRNDLIEVAEEIHKELLLDVAHIAKDVNTYYKNVLHQLNEIVDSFNVNNTDSEDISLFESQVLEESLVKGHKYMLKLAETIKTQTNVRDLSQLIFNTTSSLGIEVPTSIVVNMSSLGRYLDFITVVSDKAFVLGSHSLAWASEFQSIVTRLTEPMELVINKVNRIREKLDKNIKLEIVEAFDEYTLNISREAVTYTNIKVLKEDITYILAKLLAINKRDPSQFIDHLNSVGIKLPRSGVNNIQKRQKYFEFSVNLTLEVVNFVGETLNWYDFLIYLFDRLAEYEIQKNTDLCSNLPSQLSITDVGKSVKDTTLKEFLRDCLKKEYDLRYDEIKDILLDPAKIRSMEKVLQVTLNHKLRRSCESNGTLIIRGQYVRLSDVFAQPCYIPINNVEIFAYDKMFIDTSIDKTGDELQLAIMAPTWEVIANQTIKLDGAPGEAMYPPKALETYGYGADGVDGKPGLPGGPGGNFYGIGETFINGEGLLISVNGGNGGPGQNGGDGAKGEDGTLLDLEDDNYWMWIWNQHHSIFKKAERYLTSIFLKSSGIFSDTNLITSRGDPCSNGGNGGRGGAGGLGGNAGTVMIFRPQNAANITISQEPGQKGKDGLSGAGGEPGQSSEEVTLEVDTSVTILIIAVSENAKVVSRKPLPCYPGALGSGVNYYGVKDPKTLPDETKTLIMDCKSHLGEVVDKVLTREDLKQFQRKVGLYTQT